MKRSRHRPRRLNACSRLQKARTCSDLSMPILEQLIADLSTQVVKDSSGHELPSSFFRMLWSRSCQLSSLTLTPDQQDLHKNLASTPRSSQWPTLRTS
ncbi:hypothetical protein WJX73_002701 [Symbiochloris irregularis]|uniref:Uncharacterized protein n=1 Tax=Symbiochloris irregularis TaxID=706552 RepID=A0AAW1NLZ2_9CHLO